MNFTERQIEIIDASKDLIGRKGIQNLTIKNLAKKMSFSEPALYRHFKDKTEILKSPKENSSPGSTISISIGISNLTILL